MNKFEFQDYLRSDIKDFRRGENTDSVQLLMWTLVNCFDEDIDYVETIVCDGSKDKGIDAILVDDVEEVIFIFQSKFKEKNDRHIGDRNLGDFMGVKEWFKDRESVKKLEESTINQELKSLLEEYKISDIINDYDVEYHFVSNSFSNDDSDEYSKDVKDLFIWDLAKLENRYYLIKDEDLVSDKQIIKNVKDVIELEIDNENEIKPLIFIIPATDLINLKGIDDLTLFSKNVRYGLAIVG